MSRLAFHHQRPLNIHKKLRILRHVEFEEDEELAAPATTRNFHLLRVAADTEVLQQQHNGGKISEGVTVIPIPEFSVVDSYERDYGATFVQPATYLRGRGRVESREFVGYDLDDEDEHWLQEYNKESVVLAPEKFETILFKLEVLDHITRKRAGIEAPAFGTHVPVLLELSAADEALQPHSVRFEVVQSVYNYWKAKRELWRKPILRQLQPRPPSTDKNPYNVFRLKEKVRRLYTRRMQRRENNIQSFEKLRQIRRDLDQARLVFKELIQREEKKQDILENEVNLQRLLVKYKDEAHLVEDGQEVSGFSSDSYEYGLSEDDFMDVDGVSNAHLYAQAATMRHFPSMGSGLLMVRSSLMNGELEEKGEMEQGPQSTGWTDSRDSPEPVMLFTEPLDPERLAAAGITWPQNSPIINGSATPPHCFCGRMGRGGRLIFDRTNQRLRSPY